MYFIVTEVIRVVAVFQPSQFQLVLSGVITKVNQDEATVICNFSCNLGQTQCFLVKGKALIQIENIDIIVCKFEVHWYHLSFLQ